MKKLLLLLTLSLGANVVLLLVWLRADRADVRTATQSPAAERAGSGEQPALSTQQLAALGSGDVRELVAAGFPEDLAKTLLVGRAYTRMQTRWDAVRRKQPVSSDYWKTPGIGMPTHGKEQRAELAAASSDFNDAFRAAFGDDVPPFGTFERAYQFLPAAKADLVRRIEQDYMEIGNEMHLEMAGLWLPSDMERMKLLETEKRRDIAAALTPEELEEFNLRASHTAMNIRNSYGGAIESEEEYRKVFALQKAFDDQFNGHMAPTQQTVEQRQKAEKLHYQELRAALGDERYAALQRSLDYDYKSLHALQKRFNLPVGAPDEILRARDRYAALSQSINDDPTLTLEGRRKEIQSLVELARADLQKTLGAGAQVYTERSQWFGTLRNGMAFSTDLRDAPPETFYGGISVLLVPANPPAPSAPQPSPSR